MFDEEQGRIPSINNSGGRTAGSKSVWGNNSDTGQHGFYAQQQGALPEIKVTDVRGEDCAYCVKSLVYCCMSQQKLSLLLH